MTLLHFPGSGGSGGRREGDAAARERIRTSLDESLLVEAAAGTGKTTVLVERLVSVLASGRGRVDSVVAVTFTRKAAGELKLRLRQRLDEALRESTDAQRTRRLGDAIARLEEARIGTIHSFCAEILRERPVEAGVDPAFEEMADDEAPQIYRRAFDRWIQERLDEMPPGLSRALSRLALDSAPWEGSPLERLCDVGYQLVDWRDFTAPWRSVEIDRQARIEALVELVRRLAEQLRRGRPGDSLRRALEPVERLWGFIERSEEARGEGGDLTGADLDAFEARLLDLQRELRRPWRTRKGSGRFAEALPREQVLAARDLLREELESFRLDANADLAAQLGAELRGSIEHYETLKQSLGKLDFQDLLLRTRDLLRRHRSVLEPLRQRFTHLFVDEFQDTDPLQAEILLRLAARGGTDSQADDAARLDWLELEIEPGKLFLVGDPKQSIYRFRRADIQLYRSIQERLGERNLALVELTHSFRSTAPIQSFVNRAFASQMQADAAGVSPDYIPLTEGAEPIAGQPSIVALPVPEPYGQYRVSNESIEDSLPEVSAAWIEWLLRESGWRVRDPETNEIVPVEARHVCLLFRRYLSFRGYQRVDMTRAYTRALEARGVEHLLVGARSFHQREEVETIRAALTAVEWPDDELAVFATLRGSLFSFRDDLLLQFGQRLGFHPLRWRARAARAEELGALEPSLLEIGEALDLLARLHRRRNRRAVVETVSELLEHTRAHAGFALRPAGHQVLGNVERVSDLARSYEIGGGRSFRGFVERLEREAERPSSPQAPVVEEGADGVRLMTVHTAKGLEYPVVVLADMTAQLARREPSLAVDPERGLCAQQILGCSPVDLLERAEREHAHDRAEGVRLAYVAATRARDLLVVPVVGDEKRSGWLEPLNDAVYPEASAWRRAQPAPGCPEFGERSVLARPVSHDGRVEGSVRPGLHRFGEGTDAYEVVWWDPATLRLGVESAFGLRQEALLAEDEGGVVALENRERYEAWREREQALRMRGAAASHRPVLVTELEEEPPDGLREVEVIVLEREAERPGGRRFGTLVHDVLAHTPFDTDAERLAEIVRLRARLLSAPDDEVAAACTAVSRALEHPLLRRAAAGQCQREWPFVVPLADTRLLEGTIDLVIDGDDQEPAVLVDFKTDPELGERQERYVRQVSWYLWALERQGLAARGVLLLV